MAFLTTRCETSDGIVTTMVPARRSTSAASVTSRSVPGGRSSSSRSSSPQFVSVRNSRSAMEASALREFLTDTNWGELDLLLLDLPPGTDRLVTLAALVERLAGTIVVTIPSDVSHLVVRKAITVASQVKAPILGLVENMAGLFPGPDAAVLARDADIPLLGRVPFDPALAAAADRGEPFVAVAPESAAARALLAVAADLRQRLLSGS